MHPEAYEWVRRWVPGGPVVVLDIGGRDVNGSPRDLFDLGDYEVVDLMPGPNVDWVGDFLHYAPDLLFDVACHLEVAEHTPDWRTHMRHAHDCLALGGSLIFTAAGPNRAPHSAVDGGPVRDGEHYENVDPGDLEEALLDLFTWVQIDTTEDGADVRAVAKR